MTIFKEKRKFDVYEEAILRVFSMTPRKVTPAEVAKYLGMHPNTAKKTMIKLVKKKYLKFQTEGKRMYFSKGSKKMDI